MISAITRELRRISSLRRNHSQRVSKYSLVCRTISCHRILMTIGLASWSFKQGQLNQAITIILQRTYHANIFLNTYPVVVFSHRSMQPLLPCARSQQFFPSATIRSFGHFVQHCHCIVTWHLFAANSKLVEFLNQAASTRCCVDNKEKLSTNIRSEYASDFCHDRKYPFKKGLHA